MRAEYSEIRVRDHIVANNGPQRGKLVGSRFLIRWRPLVSSEMGLVQSEHGDMFVVSNQLRSRLVGLL